MSDVVNNHTSYDLCLFGNYHIRNDFKHCEKYHIEYDFIHSVIKSYPWRFSAAQIRKLSKSDNRVTNLHEEHLVTFFREKKVPTAYYS